jgi:hypothetical protein
MLVNNYESLLMGLRMYDANEIENVIFSTGGFIDNYHDEIDYLGNGHKEEIIRFILAPNERIIGINSHDNG